LDGKEFFNLGCFVVSFPYSGNTPRNDSHIFKELKTELVFVLSCVTTGTGRRWGIGRLIFLGNWRSW
jgi:hypothetical protein